jgi:hypothetical protein
VFRRFVIREMDQQRMTVAELSDLTGIGMLRLARIVYCRRAIDLVQAVPMSGSPGPVGWPVLERYATCLER